MTTPDGLAPPPAASSFVERHGLWTDEQASAAPRRRAGDQEEQARTGAVLLRRSARRAARQDAGRRRRAGGDAKRRHHDDDAACQGHRAQDRLSGVHRRRRLRHGGDGGRRRFRHGRRPGDLSRAAVGAEHRLAAVRHLFHQRQAGAVLDAADLCATRWRGLRPPASISSPGSRSNSICSSWRTRGSPPRMRPGRREAPEVSLLDQGYQYLTETRFDQLDAALGADPARRRGARHAAALARSRARAEPVRVHLPPADRTGRRRHDGAVPRRRKADRAPARLSRELHVPAGVAQRVFERLASASVADRARSASVNAFAGDERDGLSDGRRSLSSAACWRMRARPRLSPRRPSTATSATGPMRWRPIAPSGRATIAA